MSKLKSLKLVAKKPIRKYSHIDFRRQNLCCKLNEQLELARCTKLGSKYEVFVTKRLRDDETGQTREVQKPKKIKPWWWIAEDGSTCISIKYGAQTLELAQGQFAIETQGIEGVIASLEVVLQAAQDGELDQQIDRLAKKVPRGEEVKRPTITLRK